MEEMRATRSRRAREQERERTDRTVIYARISLDVAGEGLGVQRQEQECRALCERNGWEVAEVFTDDSVSATTGVERPEFERMLTSKPSRIVVWHTDRLVRLSDELSRVIKLDVPVIGVTAGHLDLSTPAGRAVAKTVTAWAEYEGEQKAERQKAAHRQRVKSGKPWWGHRRPFGYEIDGTLRQAEAEALRGCYERVRQGETYASCARSLNEAGLFTTVAGKPWNGSTLSRLMRDPRNAGRISYHGEDNGPGNWEPIVPLEEWRAIMDRAEAVTAGRAPSPAGQRVRSLLGGIVTCDRCGEKVKRTRQHSKRKGGETVHTYIYQCPSHCTSINADWLEQYVTRCLFRAVTLCPAAGGKAVPSVRPPFMVGSTASQDESGKAAALRAVTLRDRLADLATAYADGKVTLDQLTAGSAPLSEQLQEAETAAAAYYSAEPFAQQFSTVEELEQAWITKGSMTLDQRRDVIRRTFMALRVRPRTNRNERANADMVAVLLWDDTEDDWERTDRDTARIAYVSAGADLRPLQRAARPADLEATLEHITLIAQKGITDD